jgi:hypothetical protein
MKRIIAMTSVGLLAALVACGGGGTLAKTSNTPSTTTRPASTGKITILSPTPNQVIHGTVLHVKLQLTGAHLVPVASAHITPDTGHIHVSIDGKIKSLLAGLSYDATGLTPGTHLLTVEFVAADHGFFNPRVLVSQTFVVVK